MQFYKNSKCSNSERLISHINAENISKEDILLLSVHTPSHWCLLVCNMKRCRWDFYDSLPHSRHRSSLFALVYSVFRTA
ncbi:hypothetical protein KSP40_PGU002927 [Platanthera guangdongensis]|uniref:Ubiquitin-like protease family profile domain-containing protein n=1 Tax=Platanthera guangdongensis TaxID=2320717 RepID=A0ABR2LLC9_9ASPA